MNILHFSSYLPKLMRNYVIILLQISTLNLLCLDASNKLVSIQISNKLMTLTFIGTYFIINLHPPVSISDTVPVSPVFGL